MKAVTALVASAAAACGPFAALAQQPALSCIEVEVDGQRAPPSFDCLTQKLTPKPQTAANGAAPAALASEQIVQRPSNQLGLVNRAATGHRMGNQFGVSAFPQRPPESPGGLPLIPAAPRP